MGQAFTGSKLYYLYVEHILFDRNVDIFNDTNKSTNAWILHM